jgi:hypothetical protein
MTDAILNSVNSTNGLMQAVGLSMFNKVKDTQEMNASIMLQDFTNSQRKVLEASVQPHLGQSINVSV